MKRLAMAASLALALAAGACGDKESKNADKAGEASGGEAKGGEAKGGEAKGGEAKGGEVSLEALGLKATVPAGAQVKKAPVGDGVMIQGPDLVVTIQEASPTRPESLEGAKTDNEMYGPQNLESEELADGWLISFENEGSAGKNYFLQVRREIGGTAYWCETTASTPAQAANAAAVCKSLTQ